MKCLLRRRFLPTILCMALALGLSACGGKDTPSVETETDSAMGTLSGSKGEKDSGENYLPMLMDFGIWGDVTGLDYPEDWWLSPTDWGLAYTNWTCEHWYMEFGWGDSDPDYSGRIDLYHQLEDGQEYAYSYSGIWRMEGDCLYLDLSDGAGTRMSGSFPVLTDPSGGSLHIQQDRETGVCPPFFGEGMTCMDLIRAYG